MSGLTAKPNCRKRSTRWAFNLTGKDIFLVKTSPRDGIEKTIGNKSCKLYIGPIKLSDETQSDKHRHCLIHLISTGGGDSKTLGQMKELIKEIFPNMNFDIDFQYVTCSTKEYINFCWKTQTLLRNKVECQIKESLKKLKESGYAITVKSLKEQVIKDYGPVFYNNNKNWTEVPILYYTFVGKLKPY